METKLAPPQERGSHTGSESSITLESRHEAIVRFNEAKQRLLKINGWHALCGKASADFQLTDQRGVPIDTAPEVGNLIRIKLPAPANVAGDGFDWVRIEKFEDIRDLIKDLDIFGFRVRPVQNPKDNMPEEAHFYTSSATSSFIIVRHTSTVSVSEKGRNEIANLQARSLWDKLRNFIIAIAAKAGMATPQWKILIERILKGAEK